MYTRDHDYSAKPGSSMPPKTVESDGVRVPLPAEAGRQKPHPGSRRKRYVIGVWLTEDAYAGILRRYRERGGRGTISLSGLVAEIVYRDLGLGAMGQVIEQPPARAVPVEVQASETQRGPGRQTYAHTIAGLRSWFADRGGEVALHEFLTVFGRYRLPTTAGVSRGEKHAAIVEYWSTMRAYQSPAQIAKWFGISIRTLRRITRPYRRPKRPSTWSGRPTPAGRTLRIQRLA